MADGSRLTEWSARAKGRLLVRSRPHGAAAFLLVLSVVRAGHSEPTRSTPITLDQAVALALQHHPTVRSTRATEEEARARVDEARTTGLPGLGVSAEINRSTGNTPPGAFFPLTGFPPIAGAPQGKSFNGGYWQTGVSLWSSWDVTSLAREAAEVDLALSGSSEAKAATSARKLDIAYAAADSFLSLIEAEEAVKAARAGVDRARVFSEVVKPLVEQTLRPGVDAARADAELGVAQTELARAQQNEAARRAELGQALGDVTTRFEPVPGSLAGPFDKTGPARPVDAHPFVREAAAAADRARRAESVVNLQFLPRVDILGALWARGSGLYGSPADGLAPDIPNWAVGATLSWSALDIPAVRARAHAARANAEVAAAHRDEVSLAVAGQVERARATLAGAREVAQTTPTALASAREAEQQALARYRAGLSQAVEVADAERVLTRAEVDDAVARLEVRRALLLVARASGDLGPILGGVHSGAGKP